MIRTTIKIFLFLIFIQNFAFSDITVYNNKAKGVKVKLNGYFNADSSKKTTLVKVLPKMEISKITRPEKKSLFMYGLD